MTSHCRPRHQDDPLQIFFHIPKTAGSTLNQILTRQYGADAVYRTHTFYPHVREAAIFCARPAAQISATRVFSGHFYFGIHAHLPKPSVMFTMLRDPVQREISNYYHALRDPASAYHQRYVAHVAPHMTLEGFVGSGFDPDLDNMQTRLLAGLGDAETPVPYGQCDQAMLARAVSNLSEHFLFVGITEEFDASILLLQDLLGWNPPYYRRENIGTNRPPDHDIPRQALDAIHRNTQYDQQLYEAALHHFRALFAAQGPKFHYRWGDFPGRNKRYWQIRQPGIALVNATHRAAHAVQTLLHHRVRPV